MEDVVENVRIMAHAVPNSLTKKELGLIKKTKDIYAQRVKVLCTECKYCLPCPEDVLIPQIFSLYNEANIFNSFDGGRWQYSNLTKKGQDAGRCVACGQCEAVCPQHIRIIETLEMAHRAFSPNT